MTCASLLSSDLISRCFLLLCAGWRPLARGRLVPFVSFVVFVLPPRLHRSCSEKALAKRQVPARLFVCGKPLKWAQGPIEVTGLQA